MPGLFGIIGKGPEGVRAQEIRRMLASMYTHGPMKSGSVLFEDLHVYAGWTCHPGSYADGMPLLPDVR